MVASSLRSNQGLVATVVAVAILVASRVQLDRSQPPGAVGASFDVATHQVTTALCALLVLVVAGFVVQRRQ